MHNTKYNNLTDTQRRIIAEEVNSNPNITVEEFTSLVESVTANHWFDEIKSGLDEEGEARLEDTSKGGFGKAPNPRLVRYLNQLKDMKANVPDMFYKPLNVRKLYNELSSFCTKNDIPKEIVQHLVPSFIEYISTGYMRPTILVGGKGCGKTTAITMLCEKVLNLPTDVIKVPQLEGSRGMTGESNSYQDADCGILAKGKFKHNTLLQAYIFDEIDKVVLTTNHAHVDTELLSVTDGSASSITDNFLECKLVALEHCPFFFTANDLKLINPILADRCRVIHFPDSSLDRVMNICHKYTKKCISSKVYSDTVEMDMNLLDKYIERLYRAGITSLRKYEQFIEDVLQITLTEAMQMDSGKLKTSEFFFGQAELAVLKSENKTRIGFAS